MNKRSENKSPQEGTLRSNNQENAEGGLANLGEVEGSFVEKSIRRGKWQQFSFRNSVMKVYKGDLIQECLDWFIYHVNPWFNEANYGLFFSLWVIPPTMIRYAKPGSESIIRSWFLNTVVFNRGSLLCPLYSPTLETAQAQVSCRELALLGRFYIENSPVLFP